MASASAATTVSASAGPGVNDNISQPPLSKRRREEREATDFLADMMCAPMTTVAAEDNRHEFDVYLELPVSKDRKLTIWKEKQVEKKLPRKTLLAEQLLAIPATSTSSDCVFSVCDILLTERCAAMNTDTLEKLLF